MIRWFTGHRCVTWPASAVLLVVATTAAGQAIDPAAVVPGGDLVSDLVRGGPTSLALAVAAWLAARATSTGIPVHHTIRLDPETLSALRPKP